MMARPTRSLALRQELGITSICNIQSHIAQAWLEATLHQQGQEHGH
jgi:hypothetical protein